MRLLCLVLILFAATARAEDGAVMRCLAAENAAAVAPCKAALAVTRNDPRVWRNLAYGYVSQDKYIPAIETIAEAAARWPADPQIQYDHALILAFIRNYAAAIPPVRKVLALRPKDVRAYLLAAFVYEGAKRPADAYRMSLAAARLGDRVAMFEVSQRFESGAGVAMNNAEAVRWLHNAARAGHVAAMERLSLAYSNGELGLKRNEAKAIEWAGRARKQSGR
jgi:TPR repeat protein